MAPDGSSGVTNVFMELSLCGVTDRESLSLSAQLYVVVVAPVNKQDFLCATE